MTGPSASVVVIDVARKLMIAGDGTRTREYVRDQGGWDPATLLEGAGRLFAGGEGVLALRSSAFSLQQWVQEGMSRGWVASGQVTHSPWRSFRHRAMGTVHVLLHEHARPDQVPLTGATWEPYAAYRAYARWHELTGTAYRATPGVSAIASLRRHWWGRAAPEWRWPDRPADLAPTTPAVLMWERSGKKNGTGFVHKFDVNRQYLAAMKAGMFGWVPPVAEGAVPFDNARHGLWHIRLLHPAAVRGKIRMRPQIFTGFDAHGRGIATTPTVDYLAEQHYPFEVLDASLTPIYRRARDESGKSIPATTRLLRQWAEKWATAQRMAEVPGHSRGCICTPCRLSSALKRGPNEMVGLMASSTAATTRLDLAWAIRDVGRVGLLRKIDKAAERENGILPIRVSHDSVWYRTEDPSPAPVLAALGTAVVTDGQHGRLRHESTIPIDEYWEQRKAERR